MKTVSSSFGKHNRVHVALWDPPKKFKFVQPNSVLIPIKSYTIFYFKYMIGEFRFQEDSINELESHLMQVSSKTILEVSSMVKKLKSSTKLKRYVSELDIEKYKSPISFDVDDPEVSSFSVSLSFMIGIKRIIDLLLNTYDLICWTASNVNAKLIWDKLVLMKNHYNVQKFGNIYILTKF